MAVSYKAVGELNASPTVVFDYAAPPGFGTIREKWDRTVKVRWACLYTEERQFCFNLVISLSPLVQRWDVLKTVTEVNCICMDTRIPSMACYISLSRALKYFAVSPSVSSWV